MTETFADAVERLQDVLAEQASGWRRLLVATRAANRALGAADPGALESLLAEQVETLRDLKEIARRRERTIREVGPAGSADELRGLEDELRTLASEVSRAARVGRLVIERNGALVEARLALHRRVGRDLNGSSARVDRIA